MMILTYSFSILLCCGVLATCAYTQNLPHCNLTKLNKNKCRPAYYLFQGQNIFKKVCNCIHVIEKILYLKLQCLVKCLNKKMTSSALLFDT